jgi:hypothetical protein
MLQRAIVTHLGTMGDFQKLFHLGPKLHIIQEVIKHLRMSESRTKHRLRLDLKNSTLKCIEKKWQVLACEKGKMGQDPIIFLKK